MMVFLLLLLLLLHISQFFKTYYLPNPVQRKGFFLLMGKADNIGHRGSPMTFPENTLLSFKEALKHAKGLELDVGITKDGIIVVIHDETLERTTDGKGPVREKNLEEIEHLHAGYHFQKENSYPLRNQKIPIPTLESILKAFPNTPLIIEVKGKGDDLALNLSRTIAANQAEERVLIAGKDHETIKLVREYLPGIQTGASLKEGIFFFILAHLGLAIWFSFDFDGIFMPTHYSWLPLLTPFVRLAAKGLGIPIYLWTINQKEEMKKYLALGVHGIISDYPERVQEVLEEMEKTKGSS